MKAEATTWPSAATISGRCILECLRDQDLHINEVLVEKGSCDQWNMQPCCCVGRRARHDRHFPPSPKFSEGSCPDPERGRCGGQMQLRDFKGVPHCVERGSRHLCPAPAGTVCLVALREKASMPAISHCAVGAYLIQGFTMMDLRPLTRINPLSTLNQYNRWCTNTPIANDLQRLLPV